MAALRSLTSDGELLPVVDLMLNEQRDRIRLGRCIVCGKGHSQCDCGEYDQAYEPRDYSGDTGGEF